MHAGDIDLSNPVEAMQQLYWRALAAQQQQQQQQQQPQQPKQPRQQPAQQQEQQQPGSGDDELPPLLLPPPLPSGTALAQLPGGFGALHETSDSGGLGQAAGLEGQASGGAQVW
jgi:sortase (surface protein transpeptidase)